MRYSFYECFVIKVLVLLGVPQCGECGVSSSVVICGMMSRCGYMAWGWMCLRQNIYNVAMCGEVCCGVALVVVW